MIHRIMYTKRQDTVGCIQERQNTQRDVYMRDMTHRGSACMRDITHRGMYIYERHDTQGCVYIRVWREWIWHTE